MEIFLEYIAVGLHNIVIKGDGLHIFRHVSLIWIAEHLTYTLLIPLSEIQDESHSAKSFTICHMMFIDI